MLKDNKTLCGGNTRLVSAKLNIYTGAEGGNGSLDCHFSSYGSRKFFCKNECKAEDILIKTDDVRAQSGRFSTEYSNRSSGGGFLTVTITHLTKSDAGRYRYGLGKTLVPDSYSDFEVRVSDGPLLAGQSGFFHTETEGEELTWGCSNTVYGKQKFFCKNKCKKQEDILIETEGNQAQSGRYSITYVKGSVFGLHMTIKHLTKSDTGWYRCGYGRASSPDSYMDRFVIVTDASVPSASTPTPTTTQSQSSSSGSFTPSVSPETTDQLTASVPSASTPTPTTTQSQSSSSGSFTPSVSPETTDQLTASVPSASTPTPTTTQSQSSSSGSFTSSVSPETTDQLTASVPSASTPTPTTTQSQSSSSGSFTPSVSPETTDQVTGYFLPLVVGVTCVFVLLAVFLLLLYKWKARRNFAVNTGGNADDIHMEASVTYENLAPVSTCEESIYQTLQPASTDQDQTYSTLTANKC
ncbi:cell wall integrity and stress response component 2-like [Sebastes umbrosus]|uniref:cell wall integrity and stress response component 2-like n=1 Tax=Sebastes umbrosus TaxID=72105 RepID=UPI00189C654A|nr:cell wall integrity and stress response component 2-like [Sebastes umbrosus]